MAKSVAEGIRERIKRSSDRFWSVSDFEGGPSAVKTELARLVKTGELQRVRRGVYWRGRHTRFGVAGAPPVQAVRELISDREAVGAAGWYATNLLGLSTQVSPEPVVAVTRRPPTGLKSIRVIDRSNRTGRREERLNETEVTVLEALEAWDRNVELDHATALSSFVAILGREEVRVDRLARAASTESSRVRERLRAVLTAGGWHDEAARIEGARSPSSRARARKVLAQGDI
ncbi:MAG: DUF6088 family protein [Acidimicrobiales bacterium]